VLSQQAELGLAQRLTLDNHFGIDAHQTNIVNVRQAFDAKNRGLVEFEPIGRARCQERRRFAMAR
jgi:hypothetical protein